MYKALIIFVFLLLLSVGATASPKTQHHRKSRKAPVKAAVAQADPSAAENPAPLPTPEQGPSSPAEVTFQNGKLVIVARNSTMADVLNAVKQKTGAAVEMPMASGERVVGQFGPGAPRDVMAQLLNGSHYDYVLMGSPGDPGALKKVVLMARANGAGPSSPQQANPPPVNQNLQAVPDVSADEEQENGAEMQPEIQQEEPQPEQPQPDQPGQQQNPTIKTPEQLLRELQQQQQQQQQNAPPQ